MKALYQKSVRNKEQFTPPLVVPVPVQSANRRCLAYRDKTGVWIDYESGEPLTERVQVIQRAIP